MPIFLVIPVFAMLKLILILSFSLYAVAQIGGRDHGQLRPGLLAAQKAALLPAPARKPSPDLIVVQTAYTPPATDPSLPIVLPLVRPDAPAVAASPAPAPRPEDDIEVRYVTARSVNVREGPSTDYPVVGRLMRGEAALVLWTEDNGWSHISIEGDGIAGYVSGAYLGTEAP